MKNAVKEHGYNYNDQWLNDLQWNNTVYVWIFMILKMESKYWHNLKLYIIIDAWESNSQNLMLLIVRYWMHHCNAMHSQSCIDIWFTNAPAI